ncbi:MAG: SDR family NAD(P)-dependent oxidoreductase, partial [Inhella sp.]|uniref:SDR family NAD(P)-dependent oxidoreductase n=1 Tax=Inhella sp. TaxID=1921806 RepID=UPI00391F8191
MKLAIVTGQSRGLGHALARQLHAEGWQVLGLARRRATDLPPAIEQWEADLADPVPVAGRLQAWLAPQRPDRADAPGPGPPAAGRSSPRFAARAHAV